jgi:hypothetical protein
MAGYPRHSSGIANKDGAADVGSRETDNMLKYVNATPHTLHVYDMDSEEAVLELPTSDIVIRAGERSVRLDDTVLHGIQIPVHGCSYGDLTAHDHDGNAVEVPEAARRRVLRRRPAGRHLGAGPHRLRRVRPAGPGQRPDGRVPGLTVPHYTV